MNRLILSKLFIHKSIRRVQILLNGIWAIPCVFIIILIRPFIFISFHGIYAFKVAHLINNSVEAIYMYKKRAKGEIRLFYFSNSHQISNHHWAKMVKRTIPVYPYFAQYIGKWFNVISKNSSHHVKEDTLSMSRFFKDNKGEIDVSIKFLPAEDNQAKNWLKSIGWSEGDPIVCLLVRDSAYYMKSKTNSLYSIKNNYPFHQSYRDSDIATYLPAIQWLTQRDIFVFRMGSIANTAVDYKNKYFVDYAFMPTRSDFLDIWLFANSNGVISTGTGPDQLAVLYNKPLLYVNHLPLFYLPSYAQSITVPKNLIFKQTKTPLTLEEILNYSSTATSIQQPFNPLRYEDYSAKGIEIIDLTKQEILDATKEFWSRICDVWIESDQESLLQNSFWRQFQSHKDYYQIHNWKHPKAYVGSDWLKSQGKNFLENKN